MRGGMVMLKRRLLTLICCFVIGLGPAALGQTVDCTGVPTWDQVVLYLAANHDRVVFQGRLYESVVDSRVAQPQPGGNTWWKDLGACGQVTVQNVQIAGAWLAGLTHAVQAGTNRALILTVHVENTGAISLNSVTYGGRPMTKIIERTATSAGSQIVAYTAAFFLGEGGIAAASNGTFAPVWSVTPTQAPAFSSVFLVNVNQTTMLGASSSGVSNAASVTAAALPTVSGDRVIVAATNGNSGGYTMNNGFTEAIEVAPGSADGVAGSKLATGANETPGVTHSAPNRQSVIGFVLRSTGNVVVDSPPVFLSNPVVKPNATVGQAYSSSIAADARDPDNDPLSFAKVSGPAWLTVAANGALSGTPASPDQGLNSFSVRVTARGLSATATLNITVVGGANQNPVFSPNPFTRANAFVNRAYSSTLAGSATDPNGDPLTFSKVNGPAWLVVAASGALSGTPAAANLGLNTFTVMASDGRGGAATGTLNITVQNPPVGCDIPSKALIGYWSNFPNSGQFFPLRQVSSAFDVINLAFGLPASFTDPTIRFDLPFQFYPNNQAFANDVAALQQQGKKVVISIGGAAGAAFELNTDAQRNTFVNSVFNLITTFGLDGVDVDFEGGGPGNPIIRDANDNDFRNPTTPRIRNAILALRQIHDRFVSTFPGRCFVLSFAPETFFLQAGFQFYASAGPTTLGCYIPVIDALRDITTYVHTQDYNTGTMLGLDGRVYSQSTADFHIAMSELLLRGFRVGNSDITPGATFAPLREDQVAIGLPASPAAAGGGFTAVAAVQNAIRYLVQRTEFAGRTYTLQKATGAYPAFRGLMTWNIFHDAGNGFEFSTNHSAFLNSLP